MNRDLSASETLIMKAIWGNKGDIAIPDLLTVLKEQYGKDYARTTIVTFLLSIANKGFVETYRKGKLSYAHPLKTEEEYRNAVALKDSRMWFNEDAASFLAALHAAKPLTEEDAQKIRTFLDGLNL